MKFPECKVQKGLPVIRQLLLDHQGKQLIQTGADIRPTETQSHEIVAVDCQIFQT